MMALVGEKEVQTVLGSVSLGLILVRGCQHCNCFFKCPQKNKNQVFLLARLGTHLRRNTSSAAS